MNKAFLFLIVLRLVGRLFFERLSLSRCVMYLVPSFFYVNSWQTMFSRNVPNFSRPFLFFFTIFTAKTTRFLFYQRD